MGILEDIEELKTLQESFKSLNGEYFEFKGDKSIPIPDEGSITSIKDPERFVQPNDPVKEITKIAFEPTAKDFKFTVGKGTYVDKAGVIVGRVYMITAQRMKAGQVLETLSFKGGDARYIGKRD